MHSDDHRANSLVVGIFLDLVVEPIQLVLVKLLIRGIVEVDEVHAVFGPVIISL